MINLKKSILVLFAALQGVAYAQTYEEGFTQRANLLIDNMADVYALRAPGYLGQANVPDPEKYNWPAIIARMHKYGVQDDTSNIRITRFRNRSPFHFTLVGMARIMKQYEQAPAMQQYKDTYLTNVFNRTDGYNAFTGEGTENHTNMCRPSGYLYAQYALGNPLHPQAATRLAEMKQWILQWSKLLYRGGHGEWASSTYNTWSVVGWLNLYDFAEDPEVKLCARAVLDYYATEMALRYSQGITGGAEMRGGSANETVRADSDYLNWLWFGDIPKDVKSNFWPGNQKVSATLAAVSSYRPPVIARELAKKTLTNPAWYRESRPAYLLENPSYVKQHFYIDRNYSLGTCYFPYGGFTGGDFQTITWKLVSRVADGDSTKSAQTLTGQGRYYNQGAGRARNPYDQFAQHKNVLIQMTKTPANADDLDNSVLTLLNTWRSNWQRDFSARFPGDNKPNPVSDLRGGKNSGNKNTSYISWLNNQAPSIVRRGGVAFLQLEKTFVAVRSLAQDSASATEAESTSRTRITDAAPVGNHVGLVLEVANADDHASFEAFQNAIISAAGLDKTQLSNGIVSYTSLQGDVLSMQYQSNGTYTEPIYDWGWGPTSALALSTAPPFLAPTFPSGESHGRIATMSFNGQAQDLNTPWPVFDGPNLKMDNNTLRLETDQNFYQVDYTGNLPVFTEGALGIASNLTPNTNLNVYPNPATNQVFVNLNQSENSGLLKVYHADGKLVQAQTINQQQTIILNTSQWNRGLYFITIETPSGKKTSKLLLQ